ncbi:hypothetical protein SODALDRAFT_332987, partial [Sodiomyces alkalinus F11]
MQQLLIIGFPTGWLWRSSYSSWASPCQSSPITLLEDAAPSYLGVSKTQKGHEYGLPSRENDVSSFDMINAYFSAPSSFQLPPRALVPRRPRPCPVPLVPQLFDEVFSKLAPLSRLLSRFARPQGFVGVPAVFALVDHAVDAAYAAVKAGVSEDSRDDLVLKGEEKSH